MSRPQRAVKSHRDRMLFLISVLYDLLQCGKSLVSVRHPQGVASAPLYHMFYIISSRIRRYDNVNRPCPVSQLLQDQIHKEAVLMPESEDLAVPELCIFFPFNVHRFIQECQVINE